MYVFYKLAVHPPRSDSNTTIHFDGNNSKLCPAPPSRTHTVDHPLAANQCNGDDGTADIDSPGEQEGHRGALYCCFGLAVVFTSTLAFRLAVLDSCTHLCLQITSHAAALEVSHGVQPRGSSWIRQLLQSSKTGMQHTSSSSKLFKS
jgi:hypothetical protein